MGQNAKLASTPSRMPCSVFGRTHARIDVDIHGDYYSLPLSSMRVRVLQQCTLPVFNGLVHGLLRLMGLETMPNPPLIGCCLCMSVLAGLSLVGLSLLRRAQGGLEGKDSTLTPSG